MKNIYFDVGTTNMRIYLLVDGKIRDKAKAKLGSRDSSKAHDSGVMVRGMKTLYDELLERSGLADGQVDSIYASGMATSQFGLSNIEHLVVPVGREELARNIQPFYEDQLFRRDIFCVRGVKTCVSGDRIDISNIDQLNNMRGEEIEIIGVLPQLEDKYDDFVIVTPGSHTHLSHIKNGKIADILSCISGELYQAVAGETVLSGPLAASDSSLDEALVCEGYRQLAAVGINRAIYIAHAMNVFGAATPRQIASFTEGVLGGGLALLLSSTLKHQWKGSKAIVVAGGGRLSMATLMLIHEACPQTPAILIEPPKQGSFAVQGLLELLKIGGVVLRA